MVKTISFAHSRRNGCCDVIGGLGVFGDLIIVHAHIGGEPPEFSGAGGAESTLIVRRRSVQARNRNIVQPKVNPKLRPVMDQVVHHHASQNHKARHAQHFMAAVYQGPFNREMLIGSSRNRRASLGRMLLKAAISSSFEAARKGF